MKTWIKILTILAIPFLLLTLIPSSITPIKSLESIFIGGSNSLLQTFESKEQLRKWVLNEFETSPYIGTAWCGPRALDLQQRAELDGYRMNVDALTPQEYEKYYRDPRTLVISNEGAWPPLKSDEKHMLDSVVISGMLYYIEPVTGDIWFAGYVIGVPVEDPHLPTEQKGSTVIK